MRRHAMGSRSRFDQALPEVLFIFTMRQTIQNVLKIIAAQKDQITHTIPIPLQWSNPDDSSAFSQFIVLRKHPSCQAVNTLKWPQSAPWAAEAGKSVLFSRVCWEKETDAPDADPWCFGQ
jgi:hypothetical protein